MLACFPSSPAYRDWKKKPENTAAIVKNGIHHSGTARTVSTLSNTNAAASIQDAKGVSSMDTQRSGNKR